MSAFVNPNRNRYSLANLDSLNDMLDEVLHCIDEAVVLRCDHVTADCGLWHPSKDMFWIRFEAMDSSDYPNHIQDNGCFLEFCVSGGSVELRKTGHVYLSPADRATDKYKYLAMKSLQNIYVDYGGKKFRKTRYKDFKDLANKVAKYWNAVMESVNKYTGGYPYHQGI